MSSTEIVTIVRREISSEKSPVYECLRVQPDGDLLGLVEFGWVGKDGKMENGSIRIPPSMARELAKAIVACANEVEEMDK